MAEASLPIADYPFQEGTRPQELSREISSHRPYGSMQDDELFGEMQDAYKMSAGFDALQRFVSGTAITSEDATEILADPTSTAMASQWEIE